VEYADFEFTVDPERIIDEVTEEDPPDRQQIYGLIYGNIKLHNTTLHVLPLGKLVKEACFIRYFQILSFLLKKQPYTSVMPRKISIMFIMLMFSLN
jgi:hypothetical protein